ERAESQRLLAALTDSAWVSILRLQPLIPSTTVVASASLTNWQKSRCPLISNPPGSSAGRTCRVQRHAPPTATGPAWDFIHFLSIELIRRMAGVEHLRHA